MKKIKQLVLLIIAGLSLMCMMIAFVPFVKNTQITIAESDRTVEEEKNLFEAGRYNQNGGQVVLSSGTEFVLEAGILYGGLAFKGGAVYVSAGATFIMNGGTITGNAGIYGGAIYIEDGGTVILNGGKIEGNRGQYGEVTPAIYAENNDDLIINNSSVIGENEKYGYLTTINMYVDNILKSSFFKFGEIYTIEESDSPVPFEECAGYFLDRNFIYSAHKELDVTEIDVLNLYTKTATKTSNFVFGNGLISASSTFTGSTIVIPAEVNNQLVTGIKSDGFINKNNIISVYFPATLQSIGASSFEKCSNLGISNMPDSVKIIYQDAFSNSSIHSINGQASGEVDLIGVETIGDFAFENCSIGRITLPKTLKTMGRNPFLKNKYISELSISPENEYFSDMDKKVIYRLSDNALITALYGSMIPSETEIIVSNACAYVEFDNPVINLPNIVTIEDNAFYSSWIESVVCGDYLEVIDSNAFGCCPYLESFRSDGDSLYEINSYAFFECYELMYVDISGVTKVKKDGFYDCSPLQTIDLGDSIEELELYAFHDVSIKYIYLPSSLKKISGDGTGNYSFYDCKDLESIYCEVEKNNRPVGWQEYIEGPASIYYGVPKNVWDVYDFYGPWAFESYADLSATLVYYFGESSNVEVPENLYRYSDRLYYSSKFIESTTFRGCEFIEELVIPATVEEIEYCAFVDCINISSLTLPFIGETIDSQNFLGFYFDAQMYEENERYVPQTLTSLTITGISTTIPDYACCGCTSIEEVNLSTDITGIGIDAFSWCFPDFVINYEGGIDDWCEMSFGGLICNSESFDVSFEGVFYTDITIPDTVTVLKPFTFAGFSNLRYIRIPLSVKNIIAPNETSGPFYSCYSLSTIYCEGVYKPSVWSDYFNYRGDDDPINVVYSGKITFTSGDWTVEYDNGRGTLIGYSGSSTSPNIPASLNYDNHTYSVQYLRDTFKNNRTITSVAFQSTNANFLGIGAYTFYNCKNLAGLAIPSSVTIIDDYAFYGCENLSSCNIPTSVTTIGDYAFGYCSSKISFYLPGGITTIGDYAFYNCTGVTSAVSILSSVTSIGQYCFWGCTSIPDIYCTSFDSKPSGWDYNFNYIDYENAVRINYSNYSEFTTDGKTVRVEDNDVTLIRYIVIKHWQDEKITVTLTPEISYKGEDYWINNLGGYIFEHSPITDVYVEGFDIIGEYAFSGDSDVQRVYLSEDVIEISDDAFNGCYDLLIMEIPYSVTYIGKNAFRDCYSLEQIFIPSNVEYIAGDHPSNSPFYSCWDGLIIWLEDGTDTSRWEPYWNYYSEDDYYIPMTAFISETPKDKNNIFEDIQLSESFILTKKEEIGYDVSNFRIA